MLVVLPVEVRKPVLVLFNLVIEKKYLKNIFYWCCVVGIESTKKAGLIITFVRSVRCTLVLTAAAALTMSVHNENHFCKMQIFNKVSMYIRSK